MQHGAHGTHHPAAHAAELPPRPALSPLDARAYAELGMAAPEAPVVTPLAGTVTPCTSTNTFVNLAVGVYTLTWTPPGGVNFGRWSIYNQGAGAAWLRWDGQDAAVNAAGCIQLTAGVGTARDMGIVGIPAVQVSVAVAAQLTLEVAVVPWYYGSGNG